MSLLISSVFTYDEDAGNYIQAVETADAQALEPATRKAINNFVIGCKQDGIWTAIKASCILAGARTLTGALVPLAGTAPTNFNFVSGDYTRKTGLAGDGSSKYLNSNRNNNADPQDSKHLAVYQISHHSRNVTRAVIGSASGIGGSYLTTAQGPSRRFFSIHTSNLTVLLTESSSFVGLWGSSRNTATGYAGRYNGTNTTFEDLSTSPSSGDISVFARGGINFSNARLAFYSIGESLDLALLDARVTDLINSFAVTIP
jgi:hypothetical protein